MGRQEKKAKEIPRGQCNGETSLWSGKNNVDVKDLLHKNITRMTNWGQQIKKFCMHEDKDLAGSKLYHQLIGSLIYLTLTKPRKLL